MKSSGTGQVAKHATAGSTMRDDGATSHVQT